MPNGGLTIPEVTQGGKLYIETYSERELGVDYRSVIEARQAWEFDRLPRISTKIDQSKHIIGRYKPPPTMDITVIVKKQLESSSLPLHFENMFRQQEPYQPGLTFSNQQKKSNAVFGLNNEEEAFGLAVNFV